MSEDPQDQSRFRFYRPVKTVPVEGKEVTFADRNQRQPFTDLLGLRASGSVPEGMEISESQEMVVLSPLTSGRTLVEKRVSDRVVWGGELPADIYGALDLKGTRDEFPCLQLHQYSSDRPPEFRVFGLVDRSSLGRIAVVSSALRNLGLPTERLSRVYRRWEVLGEDGKKQSMEDWREWAYRHFCEEYRGFSNRKIRRAARDHLEETVLWAYERALQVPERVRDLANCQSKTEFQEMTGRVFGWLNAATEFTDSGLITGTPRPKKFSPDNRTDVKRYLGDWLPGQMGTYLGRAAREGIFFGFCHGQNWSAVATRYDLDSAKGTGVSLTDIPPTEEDYRRDLKLTWQTLTEYLDPDFSNHISRTYGDLLLSARVNFWRSYSQERWGEVRRPDYALLVEGGYFDGLKNHPRLIEVGEWAEILRGLGFEPEAADFRHQPPVAKRFGR